ncbi:MAG: response regulator [Candidatus Sumerlaeaceae bacterium]|nr:response regulator [Candidatus Sumerlaeaceae bacterium]
MKKILVVDDEKNIRTLFRDELEEEGYEVATAGSGREALDQIEADVPDLIVLDIRMGDMTGIEVLQELRKTHDKLPVIMVTAVRGLKDDFTIWDSHVSDYTTKPVDLDDLKAKIKKALEA